MDKVQANDESTLGSGSGSGFSDLSALENETDDFGRRLLQHQRDAERMKNAVRGNQQAFRKARPKPRVADQLEREDRAGGGVPTQTHRRTSSGGSDGSDPPVTVPREWGRKARRQGDWMRKIREPSEGSIGSKGDGKQGEDAIMPHRTAYTGDENPMQENESTPPSMRRKSTPSSMRHMNTTLGYMNDSDDGDFSAASLLASTPATRLPRRIDELTRREIETLEQHAVATRALDQINERSPNSIRRTSSTRLRERALVDDMRSRIPLSPPADRPVTAPDRAPSPSKIPRRRRSLISNKENLPINGTAPKPANLKGTETVGLVNRTEAVNIKNTFAQRPKHQRNDSMNLLKKLARVSSLSPSPASDKTGSMPEMKASSADGRPSSAKSANSDDRADLQLPQTSRMQKGTAYEAPTAGAAFGNCSDINRTEMQRRKTEDVDQTPMPGDQPLEVKTPVVTGAWIDSHVETDVRPLLKTTDSEIVRAFGSASGAATLEPSPDLLEEDLRRLANEPPTLPKSALEAIMREAQEQDAKQQYGESTIQSLEDIVEPNLDQTDTTVNVGMEVVVKPEEENVDDGRPLTQIEKDRRQEALAMEAMNKHLRNARTSIKDANRGLRRVENRIGTVQEDRYVTDDEGFDEIIIVRGPAGKYGKIECGACGGGYQSVWYALWAEYWSLFFLWDPNYKFRIRLTWLGLFCLAWWAWYLSESTLCSYYCHQLYAPVQHFPIDYNAPRFPFVIPTLFFRPWKWLWEPICNTFVESLKVLFHALFGDKSVKAEPARSPMAFARTAGRAFTKTVGRPEWIATAAETSLRFSRSVVDAVDEVGSMWDDQAL